MFNVYLPKMLEMSSGAGATVPKTLEDTMWQVVIFTLAGCPGAIVSDYGSPPQSSTLLIALFLMLHPDWCLHG